MNSIFPQIKFLPIFMGVVAISAGALVIYVGDKLFGVDLELYYGIATFNPVWIVSLFLIPFVGGFVVSLIYGLGGKILAYFPALIVRLANYIYLETTGNVPDGTTILPIGYWILVVIIAVEAAAVGGIVGEVVVKKTYGRSDKAKLHKRYQKRAAPNN